MKVSGNEEQNNVEGNKFYNLGERENQLSDEK